MKNVIVKVDGVGINATHYAGMKKEDAVKAMEKDKILETHNRDAKWAAIVYDHAVKAVADDKEKQKAEDESKKKKSGKQGIVTEEALQVQEVNLPSGVDDLGGNLK